VKHSEMLTNKEPPKRQEPIAKPLHHHFTLDKLFEDRKLSLTGRRRIA